MGRRGRFLGRRIGLGFRPIGGRRREKRERWRKREGGEREEFGMNRKKRCGERRKMKCREKGFGVDLSSHYELEILSNDRNTMFLKS